jgi:hypothetical protein
MTWPCLIQARTAFSSPARSSGGRNLPEVPMMGAMVVLWVLTTVRHSASLRVPGIAHPAH